MRIKLQLVICHDDGHEETVTDVITLNKNNQRIEHLGLSLTESKQLLSTLQRHLLQQQVTAFLDASAPCPDCGTPLQLKVLVVRYRRKYYATNRLSLTAKEVRAHYKRRHEVEEVIRTLKSQLSLEACQVGYRRPEATTARPRPCAQEHHVALCLVAYLIVARERVAQGCTWRQCKRQLILTGV